MEGLETGQLKKKYDEFGNRQIKKQSGEWYV